MMIKSFSTAPYDDPTILLNKILLKYDVDQNPAYLGKTIEVYCSTDKRVEVVVSWAQELIEVYKRGAL